MSEWKNCKRIQFKRLMKKVNALIKKIPLEKQDEVSAICKRMCMRYQLIKSDKIKKIKSQYVDSLMHQEIRENSLLYSLVLRACGFYKKGCEKHIKVFA